MVCMGVSGRPVDWERVYIFVSSTFNDMHAERDYLVKRVFPELQEWCERRKLRLVDPALRSPSCAAVVTLIRSRCQYGGHPWWSQDARLRVAATFRPNPYHITAARQRRASQAAVLL